MINLLKLNFNANYIKIQWLKIKWWPEPENLKTYSILRLAAARL